MSDILTTEELFGSQGNILTTEELFEQGKITPEIKAIKGNEIFRELPYKPKPIGYTVTEKGKGVDPFTVMGNFVEKHPLIISTGIVSPIFTGASLALSKLPRASKVFKPLLDKLPEEATVDLADLVPLPFFKTFVGKQPVPSRKLASVVLDSAQTVAEYLIAGKVESLASQKLLENAVSKLGGKLMDAGYGEAQVAIPGENIAKIGQYTPSGEALLFNLQARKIKIPPRPLAVSPEKATEMTKATEESIMPFEAKLVRPQAEPIITPPVSMPDIVTTQELFKTSEDIERLAMEKSIDEYMKGEPGKGNLYSIIKSEGGIASYKKGMVGALREEYREDVPLALRSKTGLPLDEMAYALAERYPQLEITDESSLLQALEKEKLLRQQPGAGGIVHTFPHKLAEKGVAVIGRDNIIRITQDTDATDIYGNKVKLPKGEEYTPYKLSNQQILLQDGEQIVINKNQFQNIKGQNIELGEKISPNKIPLPKEIAKLFRQQKEIQENIKQLSNPTEGKVGKGEVGEVNIEILTAPFKAIADKLDAVQYQVKHPISKAIVNDIQYVNIKAHRGAAEWLMRVDYFKGLKKEYDTLLTDLMEGKHIDLPKEEFNKLFILKQKLRKSLEEAWQKANAVGVKVKITDETGTHWRPIGKIENYVPREIHPDIREQLQGGLKQLYDKMLELRDKGVMDNVKQAILAGKKSTNTYIVRLLKWLEEKKMKMTASTLIRLIDKLVNRDYIASYGHLERPRLIEDALPPEFYERRASVLFTRYFASAARRIAEIECFGQVNEKLLRRLRFVERVNPKEGKILRDLFKTYQDKTKHPITNTLANIISTVKIGLGTSTIPNITQTLISTIPKQGVFNFLRGALNLIANPQTRLFIQKTGLPYIDVVKGIMGYEDYGLLGRVNNLLLTANWFKGVNRLNALLTASSTERWATKVLIPAVYSSFPGRKQWALDNLAKLKIYPKDIKGRQVSDEKLIDAMYIAASNYQLFSDITNEPLFLSQPSNRWFTILKRFGYKQGLFVMHELIYDELKHGNPLPLLRLIAGGILGGAFVIWANRKIYDTISYTKEKITGENREPPDWYAKWDDEDVSIMNKAIDLIAQAGTVGALTDITRIDSKGKWSLERHVEFQLKPVVISELERGARIVDILKKGETKTGRRVIEIVPADRIKKVLQEISKTFPITKFFMEKNDL